MLSYTILTDILVELTGTAPITDDILLNSLYGGIMLGVGLGLVYLDAGQAEGQIFWGASSISGWECPYRWLT